MHIPEGYLSPSTCAALTAAAMPFWAVALQQLKRLLTTRMVPLIAIFAAFSFVIMMFNLPLPGGTTGHAVGMTIATVVLGPWGSIIAVSVALILQALLFGDGGILAIGANCLNMAIIGSLVAYGMYRLIANRSPLTSFRRVIAGVIAGYIAINVSALAAAIEFGVQPLLFKDANGAPLYSFYPLSVAIPAMAIGHLTIAGFAEAIVTGGVILFLQRVDPSLLKISAPELDTPQEAAQRPPRLRPLIIGLLVLCFLTPLGLLAAGTAWGEWGGDELAAEQSGFYMRQLSPTDRDALVADFDKLAAATPDAALANEYKSAAAALKEGKLADTVHVVQSHIGDLRGADLASYPQLEAMLSTIKEPQGLLQLSSLWSAPIPGYAPGFISNETIGYIFSAIVGVTLVAMVAYLIGRAFARREPRSP